MDKILLFIGYFLFSLVTIKLASLLFGIYNKDKKILLISLIGCTADYIVQELIEPKFSSFEGLHFITGIILITVACYIILKTKLWISFSISILSYILGIITEVIIILLITYIWGKDILLLLKNNDTRTIIGIFITMPLLIPTFYLQKKKINILNKHM